MKVMTELKEMKLLENLTLKDDSTLSYLQIIKYLPQNLKTLSITFNHPIMFLSYPLITSITQKCPLIEFHLANLMVDINLENLDKPLIPYDSPINFSRYRCLECKVGPSCLYIKIEDKLTNSVLCLNSLEYSTA